MNHAEYLSLPGISASAIKAGAVSMAHMREVMICSHKEPSPAMMAGTRIHAAVLEPDRLAERLHVWTGGVKRGKDWDAFSDGKPREWIVTFDEVDELDAIASAVKASRPAQEVLGNALGYEYTLQWTDRLLGQCKARLDCITRNAVIDLKTTAQIDPRAFGRTFASLDYLLQLGWYCHGYELIHGERPQCFVVAQETARPYATVVYEVDEDLLVMGYDRAYDIALRYRACEACGEYPGPASELLGIRDYLPGWYTGDKPDVVPDAEISVEEL
jgi:hypothetical protein